MQPNRGSLRAGNGHYGGRRKLNEALFWPLTLIALVAPLLMGGNRPFFWLLWGMIAGALGLAWFGAMAIKGEKPRFTPRDFPEILVFFCLFVGFTLLQILPLQGVWPPVPSGTAEGTSFPLSTISVAPGQTFFSVVRWLTYGIIFFLVVQLTGDPRRAQRFLLALFWTIVAHAVLGLLFRFQLNDTLLGLPKWAYTDSTTGGFVNRNSFATYLAFGAVIGLSHILERLADEPHAKSKRSPKEQDNPTSLVPLIVGWLFIMTALVTTNSRMGLVSGLAGLIAAFILIAYSSSRTGKSRRLRWAGLGFVGLAILALALFGSTLYERSEHLFLNQDIAARFNLYRQVMDMIADRPLLGFGGGAFEQAYPLYHLPPVSSDGLWDKAHSTYLALWSEYGLLFGTLPMLIIIAVLARLIFALRHAQRVNVTVVSSISIIVVGALHSLFDFSLEMEGNSLIFLMVIATGFTAGLTAKRKTGRHEP